MLRKVVLGSIGVAGLMPVVGAATVIKEESVTQDGPAKPPPMRPSDLPIYDAPHADYAEYLKSKNQTTSPGHIKSFLLAPVTAVREQVQVVVEHTSHVKHSVEDQYHELQDKTDWIMKYLREEENKDARYGAVAMGGLTGFIFGLRGGIIRRLIYASAGTTGMGLVCFPEETTDILKSNSALAKQYINIAYNFFYGVKPGDPQLEVKFPELSLPKDFSELVDMAISLASSIKQAVMPPPTKDETKPAEKKE